MLAHQSNCTCGHSPVVLFALGTPSSSCERRVKQVVFPAHHKCSVWKQASRSHRRVYTEFLCGATFFRLACVKELKYSRFAAGCCGMQTAANDAVPPSLRISGKLTENEDCVRSPASSRNLESHEQTTASMLIASYSEIDGTVGAGSPQNGSVLMPSEEIPAIDSTLPGIELNMSGEVGDGVSADDVRRVEKAEDHEVVESPSAEDPAITLPTNYRNLNFNQPDGVCSDLMRKPQSQQSVEAPQIVGNVADGQEAQEGDFYIPQVGDVVIGVVVSSNERLLDVEIGAEKLGQMLSKEVYPLDKFKSTDCVWELPADKSATIVPPLGQIRVVHEDEALQISTIRGPLAEVGTVLPLEVQGLTVSGRALLSARKLGSRVAWHRIKQIQDRNEPFEVSISDWNLNGLATIIEGIRAFLPLSQFLQNPGSFSSLQEHVNEWKYVLITETDQETGKLIVSEKKAWEWRHLQTGTLHEGTVTRVESYGAEIRLNGTNIRGLVHKSNISCHYVKNVDDIFSVGDLVKVLVVPSPSLSRLSLSTADLEAVAGLMLVDKERVFKEAEGMAAAYREHHKKDTDKKKKERRTPTYKEKDIANLRWLDFVEQ